MTVVIGKTSHRESFSKIAAVLGNVRKESGKTEDDSSMCMWYGRSQLSMSGLVDPRNVTC